jgi:hypothetical protein
MSGASLCALTLALSALRRQLETQPRHALALQQHAPVGAVAAVLVAPGGLAGGADGEADRCQHGVDLVDAAGNGRLQGCPFLLERSARRLARRRAIACGRERPAGLRLRGRQGQGMGLGRGQRRTGGGDGLGRREVGARLRRGVVGDGDLGLGLGLDRARVPFGHERATALGTRIAPHEGDAGADQHTADEQDERGGHDGCFPAAALGLEPRPLTARNAGAARVEPRREGDGDATCPATPPSPPCISTE